MSVKNSVEVESANWSCSSTIVSLDSNFELTYSDDLEISVTQIDNPRIPKSIKQKTIPRNKPVDLVFKYECSSLSAEIFI